MMAVTNTKSAQCGASSGHRRRVAMVRTAGNTHRFDAAATRTGKYTRARSVQCPFFARRQGTRASQLVAKVTVAETNPADMRIILFTLRSILATSPGRSIERVFSDIVTITPETVKDEIIKLPAAKGCVSAAGLADYVCTAERG